MDAHAETPPTADGAVGSSFIVTVVIGVLTLLTALLIAKRFLSSSKAPPKKKKAGRTRRDSGDDELVSVFDVIREGKSSKPKSKSKGRVKKPEEKLAAPSVQKTTAPKKKASTTSAPTESSKSSKKSKPAATSEPAPPAARSNKENRSSHNSENAPSIKPKVTSPAESAPVTNGSGGASPEAVRDEDVNDDLPRDVRTQLNYTLVGYDESVDPDTPPAEAEGAPTASPEIHQREPEPEQEQEESEPEAEEEPEPVVPAVKRKAKRRTLRRI